MSSNSYSPAIITRVFTNAFAGNVTTKIFGGYAFYFDEKIVFFLIFTLTNCVEGFLILEKNAKGKPKGKDEQGKHEHDLFRGKFTRTEK